MKDYKTEQIRNPVLLGHGGTGKTSLAEAALFSTGAAHLGQNRSGRGSFVPQSWQNFPGGPMRRQVGHMTDWG